MNLNYKKTFLQWELTVAKKLVYEYQEKFECLKRIGFNDLLQEVLIHWYFNKEKFNPDRKTKEKTFMAKIVENKLTDILREVKTDKRTLNYQTISLDQPLGDDENCPTLGDVISENDILSGNNITSDPFSKISLKIDLEKALQKLNPIQKKICNLIIKKGLNILELSEYLNTPRSTIYDEKKRIRKIFEKEHLKNYWK